MAQQFKVVTHIRSPREASKDFQPQDFENIVNSYLQNGWKVVNCESGSSGTVSRTAGMYLIAYLVKD